MREVSKFPSEWTKFSIVNGLEQAMAHGWHHMVLWCYLWAKIDNTKMYN